MTSLVYSRDLAAAHRAEDGLAIFCLLPTLNPYGGVISVVNAVNIWLMHGHRVVLGSLSSHPEDLVAPRTEPIHFEEPEQIHDRLGTSFDVALATSWHTAAPIATMAEAGGAVPWYYVQDYEPDFYDDAATRAAAHATYDLIPNRVTKTEYLCGRLAAYGWDSHKIPPGMNLDIFYPRSGVESPVDVLGMARPPADKSAHDHRGHATLTKVFESLVERRPEIRLATFGSDTAAPAGARGHGRVSPRHLPAIYSSASVFVDTSRSHGFGRTGLEAMACGTPPVLTASGGVSEYARHEENALLAPVDDVEAIVASIERLLDDGELRSRLAVAGRSTASRYSDEIASDELIRLFRQSTHHRRSGSHPHTSRYTYPVLTAGSTAGSGSSDQSPE